MEMMFRRGLRLLTAYFELDPIGYVCRHKMISYTGRNRDDDGDGCSLRLGGIPPGGLGIVISTLLFQTTPTGFDISYSSLEREVLNIISPTKNKRTTALRH
mmetsp:Transcript_6845/g.16853  ORF Transcript_6845/g.16853 Transcript_6845/m.16853 type:complete len:101 (+) Transcript_6845:767-1069(+)